LRIPYRARIAITATLCQSDQDFHPLENALSKTSVIETKIGDNNVLLFDFEFIIDNRIQ
jgi:hypothetical protein